MEDKLKRFVDDNREAFDKFEPRPEVWESLEKKLGKQKKTRVIAFQPNMLWRYAAGIVLVLGFSYGLIQFGRHLGHTDSTPGPQPVALEKIAPEMAEVETYYLSIINQKKELRNNYNLKQMGLEKDFSGEIAQLDSTYTQLKKELTTNPNKQKVMDAMVLNLQIRISILNQQLKVLNQIKEVKTTKDNEKVSI